MGVVVWAMNAWLAFFLQQRVARVHSSNAAWLAFLIEKAATRLLLFQ
jgi:hypothetical protein